MMLNQKIYFGHQSVGENILQGIREISAESSEYHLEIVEAEGSRIFDRPGIFHSRVGQNTFPYSKLEAFSNIVRQGVGNHIDMAFFKFCYIDINAYTDVEELFHAYATSMANLALEYPQMKFAHCTVPLRTVQVGLKVPVKKMMGQKVGGYEENIKRCEFNTLIRKEYASSGLLFDLAAVEAELPDGKQCSFRQHGKRYEALAPQYTDDGGHLNRDGRKRVAGQFLSFLSGL